MADWIDSLSPDIQSFVKQISGLPDFPEQLAAFAALLHRRQNEKDSISRELARRAWGLAPDNPRVRRATEWAVRKNIPNWHFSIVRDVGRNRAYERALKRFVTPETVALEIGAGSGLVSMYAARLGAKHVYTCEAEPLVAEAARENISRNGYADRITVIPKKSTELIVGEDIPSPADLLLSEIMDNVLVGEGILPTMEDALPRLVKPGAPVLPIRVAARGALMGGAAWASEGRIGRVDGFDLSAFNRLSPASIMPKTKDRGMEDAFSEDVDLFRFDFESERNFPAESKEINLRVTRDGVAYGFLQWVWMEFSDDIWYDNRPPAETSWEPLFYVFREPKPVRVGETVRLRVEHNRETLIVWPI